MDVYQVRYANLQTLIEAEGGLDSGGLTRVAERLGKSQGQVSHFGGRNPIKNIGHKMAREIEAKFGKPAGWMDSSHISDSNVSYLPSQPTGQASSSMALAVELTRFWMDLNLLPGSVEDHIPLLAIAHELVLEARGTGVPGNVLDLSKKLAARLREEKKDGDERREGPGAGGSGTGLRGKSARERDA